MATSRSSATPDQTGRRTRKAGAIKDICDGTRYYVEVGGNEVDIHVVNGPSGKYLRTDRDQSSNNNLDDLPDC